MINAVKQVVRIMPDERVFPSIIILLFLGRLSLFPTLTQTYMTQMIRKGNYLPEREYLFKLFEGFYICPIQCELILKVSEGVVLCERNRPQILNYEIF